MTDPHASPPAATPPEGLARRQFLALAGASLGACAGAAVLGAVGVAVTATPLTAEGEGAAWCDLGPLERFPDRTSLKVSVEGVAHDAWSKLPAQSLGRVVVRRAGDAAQVLSATCPHNGCEVFVTEADLLCPCHDSHFAHDDGALRTGKSPRGLDPLESRVEDGHLHVRFVRYEVGTAERRPV